MAQYEVLIRNETADDNKSPIAGSNAPKKDTTPVSGNGGNSGSVGGIAAWRRNVAKGIAVTNTYVKPFADSLITQKVSTVELRTGAVELEDKMSLGLQFGEKAVGLGMSIATGALVGGLAGALVGAFMSLATSAISYANKQEQISLQRTVEHTGLQFMNIRAGGSVASFSGSRLRDQ